MTQENITSDGGLKNQPDPQQDNQPQESSHTMTNLSLSTQALHADDKLNTFPDVAPALHVSTTFRYTNDPNLLIPESELDPNIPQDAHIYSRETAPNTTRLEAILSTLLKGPCITYASGLSAFHALLVLLNPKAISIGQGYHGCHGVITIHQRLTGLKKLSLDCDPSLLQPGDIIHLETPLNPTGKITNIAAFAAKAHGRGAILTIDATFAPPPLQDPFAWGADIILHSGTKYFGGHSDLLCGILAINPARASEGWYETLKNDRTYLGNVLGNFESWLSIRSVRTLGIRVERQSYNTTKLVRWFEESLHTSDIAAVHARKQEEDGEIVRKVVANVLHGSLQSEDVEDGWITQQMPNGMGPVFAVVMRDEGFARRLPSKLRLWQHATSLGGVESLIEWRAMSDDTVDRRLMRLSTGIEGWEDLRDDLLNGFRLLMAEG